MAVRGADSSEVSLKAIRRLTDDRGYTLAELVVLVSLLSVVLAPLATSLVSSFRSQALIVRREKAAQDARLAMQRMQVDIRCAGNDTSVDQNGVGGFTLTLSENNGSSPGQVGWCPGVIPADLSAASQPDGVQWCTAPAGDGSFVLYRYYVYSAGDATQCGETPNASFQVDGIVEPAAGWPVNTNTTSTPDSWVGNLWPSGERCENGTASSGALPMLSVDINVAPDTAHLSDHYEIRSSIGLRNASRCD